jgi:hypothetical protein
MEKIIVHTKQEVINAFLELSPKEQEEVKEFVNSINGDVDFLVKGFEAEYVREENYSEEDIAELNRISEEAKQGINMSGPFRGKEAIDYLTKLEEQAQI